MTSANAGAPSPRHLGLTAGLGVAQIVSWGTYHYSFALLADPLGQELGVDKATVYGAATLGLIISALAAFPVGSLIDRGRGRAIMVLGSLLGGLMLIGWGRVADLWTLYAIHAVIGLVQAMTLYEPAFAVLNRQTGKDARKAITNLTLWGGFSSTVFVPLIQFLMDSVGWRDTLVILGLINITLCVGLHLLVIERAPAPEPDNALTKAISRENEREAVRIAMRHPSFWLLAFTFTAYHFAVPVMTFHTYPMLLERGFGTGAVVLAMAMIGPAQVAGRVILGTFLMNQPIRRIGSIIVCMLPVALALLWLFPAGFAVLVPFAILYGSCIGIMTIVRGTSVPELVTRQAYGAINGAMNLPGTIAKALSPLAAAMLWQATGSYDAVLLACVATALLSVGGYWGAVMMARRADARRLVNS